VATAVELTFAFAGEAAGGEAGEVTGASLPSPSLRAYFGRGFDEGRFAGTNVGTVRWVVGEVESSGLVEVGEGDVWTGCVGC